MRTRAQMMTRRGAGVVAALAVASAVLFNLPAQAENQACGPLQASYIANPAARPQLLAALQALSCSVPGSGSTTSTTSGATTTSTATSSTTSTSTSTTVFNPNTVNCTALVASYSANPTGQSALLPLLQAAGCTVPAPTTSTTRPATTTSSSTTSTTRATTTTTVTPSASCSGLIAAYLAAPAEIRTQLLPTLRAQGCSVPVVIAEEE